VDPKTLKLLVVEDDLEDEQMLCEALIEIEEDRLWLSWPCASIVQVDQLADALDCIGRENFDAVLLNLSMPDSPTLLDTFLDVRAELEAARGPNGESAGSPVIVLLDEADESLANRLIREGAQDVVVKTELECAGLARSVRYAIERQRRASCSEGAILHDTLTGTLGRPAFLVVAEPYARLAIEEHVNPLAGTLEVADSLADESLGTERQASELIMLRAGEALRDAFPGPALFGRLAPGIFALLTTGLASSLVEELLHGVGAEIEATGSAIGRSVRVRFHVQSIQSVGDLLPALRGMSTEPDRGVTKTAILAD
jgi:CheY-like chemotaxis protein